MINKYINSRHLSDEFCIIKHQQGIKIVRPNPSLENILPSLQEMKQSLPYNFFILEKEDKKIIDMNELHAEQTLSFTKKEMLGKNSSHFSDFKSAQKVLANDNFVLSQEQSFFVEEKCVLSIGNIAIHNLNCKMPLYGESGILIGILGFSVNVHNGLLAQFFTDLMKMGFLNETSLANAGTLSKTIGPKNIQVNKIVNHFHSLLHATEFNNFKEKISYYHSRKIKSSFTKRETECMFLLCKGLRYKEIGQALAISDRTVETHLMNVRQKLNFTSRSQLIRYIYKNIFRI